MIGTVDNDNVHAPLDSGSKTTIDFYKKHGTPNVYVEDFYVEGR
jgi:hypothetical protein